MSAHNLRWRSPCRATPSQMNALRSEFAEHLSNGLSLSDIAKIMDVTGGTVCVWLHQLCVRLGETG
jgi:DNA-directed RNA polymerase specialized sigma24 family protein